MNDTLKKMLFGSRAFSNTEVANNEETMNTSTTTSTKKIHRKKEAIITCIIFIAIISLVVTISYLTSNKNKIVGRWECPEGVEITLSSGWGIPDRRYNVYDDEDYAIIMEFKRNGTYSYEYIEDETGVLIRKEGTYTVKGDFLTINGDSIMSDVDNGILSDEDHGSNTYKISHIDSDSLNLKWSNKYVMFDKVNKQQ